jgi:histidyl-tRNA synthetase
MSKANTQPARGMRDFLPADVRKREYVIGVVKEVYERYGFEPLETPAVENIETLLGKYGDEGNQLIYKILKRGEHEKTGEADLALRYDLTVPLARVVAEYRDKLPKFFKRYQIQPVWRADRPARGRFREFYQCDVDVLGSRSMVVEAEICAAASDALVALGFNDFTVRMNHRQLLNGILEATGVPSDKHNDFLVALDKLDKIGHEGVFREFQQRGILLGEGNKAARFLLDLELPWVRKASEVEVQVRGDLNAEERSAVNNELLGKIGEVVTGSIDGQNGLAELKSLLALIEQTPAKGRVEIDPFLARGLSYYTGTIFEITVPGLAGSLGGGGRYDNLVGMFRGEAVPACGFSLGLERILIVMTDEMFPPHVTGSPADVMVSIWNQESIADSISLAQELRGAGLRLRVDLYPEADKLGKQFKYASERRIPFVAVIGDEERARSKVSIKDMRSGIQRSVKREDLAVTLRESL